MAKQGTRSRSSALRSSERKLKATAEARQRQLAAKSPDMDIVDEALSAAIMSLMKTGASASGEVVLISKGAVEHLVNRGYSRSKAKARLLERLSVARRYRYRDAPGKISIFD